MNNSIHFGKPTAVEKRSLTKCIYSPTHKCGYDDCLDCPDYAEITQPDWDLLFDMEREEKMYD